MKAGCSNQAIAKQLTSTTTTLRVCPAANAFILRTPFNTPIKTLLTAKNIRPGAVKAIPLPTCSLSVNSPMGWLRKYTAIETTSPDPVANMIAAAETTPKYSGFSSNSDVNFYTESCNPITAK